MVKTGFTLIELIIVIAVIAILATTVILVINPVGILQEARDSQRIADLSQMNTAIGLYLATYQGTIALGTSTNCYAHRADLTANCGGRHAGKTTTGSIVRTLSGGWLPVDLSVLSNPPLANWPVDPSNNTTYFYSYVTGGATVATFEIDANMESVRYREGGGTGDVETTDGGTNAGAVWAANSDVYEVGNNVAL